MPHCGLRHSCCNARAAVRRARALELLESVHRPRMRAGLEVVPPTTGPGVVTLRKAQEFAERALGPRAPLGELKAAAVVRVRVPENLLAPREWRPPLRRAAGGAAQSAQHHQRCAQKPRVKPAGNHRERISWPEMPSSHPSLGLCVFFLSFFHGQRTKSKGRCAD